MDRIVTPSGTVCMPGGTSIYFSNAIAALPVQYALVTALADADVSALAPLQQKGVHVTAYSLPHTLFFENSYGEDPNERTQRVLQVAEPFTPKQVTALDATIYHLGTLLAGDIPAGAIKALAAKGKLSLDVQGYLRKVEDGAVLPIDWVEKEALLPFIYFVKASEEELQVLTGCANIAEGARKLLNWGTKEVVITCGSRGSEVYTAEESFSIPAFVPALTTDATGCGDTYMAGYLYKRCKGAGIQEAGEFAAAMATLKIEASGPFAGTEEEVEAVRQNNERRYLRTGYSG
jgi:sugar/nucleoside kinase (ribokinase family)